MPREAGLEEPVVVGLMDAGSDDPGKPTAGGATLQAVGSAASGAAGGAAVGGPFAPFTAAAGAIIGALVSAFKSIGSALSTTPDDARRYLYEIGVPLRGARVAVPVSAHDLLVIRHARFVDLADKDNFGLDKINDWLQTAGETNGDPALNPMSSDVLLANEAEAFIALEREHVQHKDDDVEVPSPDAPAVPRGKCALHRAIIARLRDDPDLVTQIRRQIRTKAGDARYVHWVADLQKAAGDHGPNPMVVVPFDTGWLWVGGVAVVAAVVGGVLVLHSRRAAHLNQLAERTPSEQAFHDVLHVGVSDGDLEYPRRGMRSLAPLQKTFRDASLLGIAPTELAVSGRYFGEEVLPVRIEVGADGGVRLADGRRRYTAAKQAGATSILADVVRLDSTGDVVAERRAAVRLL